MSMCIVILNHKEKTICYKKTKVVEESVKKHSKIDYITKVMRHASKGNENGEAWGKRIAKSYNISCRSNFRIKVH